MIILGVDPGYATVGIGITEFFNEKFRLITYGTITTPPKTDFNVRLETIFNDLTGILTEYKPGAVAVEELFFTSNPKTAIAVAQARGVICLAVQKQAVPIFEYTPLQVKSAVTGYGKAEKAQVMEMTRSILNLRELPRPDDAADALALTICHAHSSESAIASVYRNFGYQKK